MYKRNITLLDAVTSTTSKEFEVRNAKSLMAVFTRANHSSGSSVFKIEGSIDGTTFFSLPLTVLAANTNTETLKRDLSVTLSANGSEARIIEPIFLSMLTHIKVTVTINTDGNGTVKLAIEDELN